MPEATANDFLEMQDYADEPAVFGGKEVFLRKFTIVERDDYSSNPPMENEKPLYSITHWRLAKAIFYGIVDSSGSKIFSLDDALELVNKRNGIGVEMGNAVVELNNRERESANKEAESLGKDKDSGNSPS